MKSEAVRAWRETVQIPTYSLGKPDRNPMFLDRRVYQGSSGKVYPHAVTDTLSDVRGNQAYTALCLENEYLYIMILPELGGRVQRALDKTNGYDFIYYNRVIKPAMVGLAGPWISGGIEFNWPQHHRPSTFDPVSWKIEKNPDGSQSVITGEIEQMFRTKGMSRFTLYPGKAYLEIRTQLYNRTDEPQTFLWWANPAVAVNDSKRSIVPPDVHAVMDHGKRDVSDFPIAHGVYYKQDYSAGVDISRYRNIPVPTSYMAAHSDYDFLGNYDDSRQAGMLHIADHHISPGKKQWTWGNGEFGRAWDRNLTDEDGPYIELMAGCYTDNQPDFSWLMPGEEKRFTQVFMPYKGVGAVKNANRDAVLGVERDGGEARMTVYVSSAMEGCRLQMLQDGRVIAEKTCGLSPEASVTLTAQADEKLITGRVLSGDGRELVAWREEPAQDTPLPRPAEPIPPAGEIKTNEQLLRYGTHLEQYRHATWDAMDYYQEGIRRDPDDVRMQTALAKLLMRRGLTEDAVPHLRQAIRSCQEKNPNPYDGECFYQLGVALSLLGDEEGAYDAFFKATWNAAWAGAAYERIGCIDLRKGRPERAAEHLRLAVDAGSRSMMARDALGLALAALHRTDEARECFRETLRLDPLDAVAAMELGLDWSGTVGKNPAPYLEIALEYRRAGRKDRAETVLRQGILATGALLLWLHLAAVTGDREALRQARGVSPDGCFPHRTEDHLAILRCEEMDPDFYALYYADGNYWYDRKQPEKAAAAWRKAVRLRPDFATAHRNLAIVLYNHEKNGAAALAEMKTAFACDPSDARVLMELDDLARRMKVSAEERLALLEKQSGLLGMRDDLAVAYAQVLNMTGKHGQALAWIDSRRFHPWEGGEGKAPTQWRTAMLALAQQETDEGRLDQAEQRIRRVIGPYPHHLGEGKLPACADNDASFLLGVCLEKQGKTREAQAAFLSAASGSCEIASALYYNDQPPERIAWQGLALRKLGREKEAQARFDALRSFAAAHGNDRVTHEYFAVSLPELAIFQEDLTAGNHIQCLLLDAFGAAGAGDRTGLRKALDELTAADPWHPGITQQLKPFLKQIGFPGLLGEK